MLCKFGRGSFGTAGGEGHGGGGGGGQGMSENIHLGSARLYGGRVGVHDGNQSDVLLCTDLLLPLGNPRQYIAALELSSSSSARGYSRELRHQVKLAKRYTGYADDTKCEEE